MTDMTQLFRLQNEISAFVLQLGNAEEKIERLESAKKSLSSEQEMLHDHKAKIKEPELDGDNWSGNEASDHEEIRSDMYTAYTDSRDKVEQMLSSIETEISNLRGEANRCSASIASKESSLQLLRNRIIT
ncbi:DUF5082 domain-containing protein [Shouchella patagoniensis]|uniref:DUF5082 domain-containing protein n=1 Tax=Shouchella patagoniensis TaxID=228576 RepID=UPI0009958996|nr:DUF5082 domain-containing protein [Shouchella patagoniensis]